MCAFTYYLDDQQQYSVHNAHLTSISPEQIEVFKEIMQGRMSIDPSNLQEAYVIGGGGRKVSRARAKVIDHVRSLTTFLNSPCNEDATELRTSERWLRARTKLRPFLIDFAKSLVVSEVSSVAFPDVPEAKARTEEQPGSSMRTGERRRRARAKVRPFLIDFTKSLLALSERRLRACAKVRPFLIDFAKSLTVLGASSVAFPDVPGVKAGTDEKPDSQCPCCGLMKAHLYGHVSHAALALAVSVNQDCEKQLKAYGIELGLQSNRNRYFGICKDCESSASLALAAAGQTYHSASCDKFVNPVVFFSAFGEHEQAVQHSDYTLVSYSLVSID